jgi:hypothetical protein
MLGVKIDDSPTTLKAVTAAIIENAHMHRSDTLAWFGGHGLQQLKRTAAPAEPHVETAQFPRAYVSGVVPSAWSHRWWTPSRCMLLRRRRR